MFDMELLERIATDGAELQAVLADPTSPAFDRFQAGVELANLAEAAQAAAALEMADAEGWDTHDDYDEYERRLVRVGSDGTPLVDEFLPSEVAATMGVSVGTATLYLRDVVNLRYRHPNTWAIIQDGELPVWRGRQIALSCCHLTKDQGLAVDLALKPLLGRFGWNRVNACMKATILELDPPQQRPEHRFVHRYRSDNPVTGFIDASVDRSDAILIDNTVGRIAEILARNGDSDDRDHRRAKALGILANPQQALNLLTGANQPVTHPTSQVFVHIHQESLTNQAGLVRIETEGPALVEHLAQILGHNQIKLTPVIHLDHDSPIDAY